MDILFVTPEVAPYSKVGGLGDVCGALPKALHALGHHVTVVSPLYANIDPGLRTLARRLNKIEAKLGRETYPCEVYDGRTPAGVDVTFVGQEQLFRKSAEVYSGDDRLDAVRFTVLCRAAVQIVKDRGCDVLHAHDWGAALSVLLAKRDPALASLRTVLTIHNVAHQGMFPADMLDELGLPRELFNPNGIEFYGKLCLLKGGIVAADRITTVSPTYAREITRPAGGHGLDGALAARGSALVGILNGIDTSVWNPATDTLIAARFDPMDQTGKARCKVALQHELGLPERDDVPLIGTVGRLVTQKGYDLFAKAAAQLLRNDVQLAVLGLGDDPLQDVLGELSRRWPDRLQTRFALDEGLAHRIVAGSDLFLMPSRFEPCGLTQMYAHRYGTLPIVHATGGLADTVIDCDAGLETGTGFRFEEATADELLAASRRGIAAFTKRDAFRALQRRVMRLDWSWARSARLYERLYKELTTPAAS